MRLRALSKDLSRRRVRLQSCAGILMRISLLIEIRRRCYRDADKSEKSPHPLGKRRSLALAGFVNCPGRIFGKSAISPEGETYAVVSTDHRLRRIGLLSALDGRCGRILHA